MTTPPSPPQWMSDAAKAIIRIIGVDDAQAYDGTLVERVAAGLARHAPEPSAAETIEDVEAVYATVDGVGWCKCWPMETTTGLTKTERELAEANARIDAIERELNTIGHEAGCGIDDTTLAIHNVLIRVGKATGSERWRGELRPAEKGSA